MRCLQPWPAQGAAPRRSLRIRREARVLGGHWGTVVMAVTGFLLWFKAFRDRLARVPDVGRRPRPHDPLYEAWLATLAIVSGTSTS